ncbi:MAG: glycine--tRNA ligase subunit alpha, partial [Actinobacteria bacterium]
GMECPQFTYFQQVGGFACRPVPAEITYGLERLAMYIQGVDSVYDIVWARGDDGLVFTYADVFLRNEQLYSAYNFEVADTDMLYRLFDTYEAECRRTLEAGLCLPAYDFVLKCSHAFNLLDARGAIAVAERVNFIGRVRALAKACCEAYVADVAAQAGEGAPMGDAPVGEAAEQPAPLTGGGDAS